MLMFRLIEGMFFGSQEANGHSCRQRAALSDVTAAAAPGWWIYKHTEEVN